MTIRDVTISDIDRLRADADTADVAFEMDEETFRAFYDRTARPLWTYLSRLSGDAQAADDLLQETYYRFLRARSRRGIRGAPPRVPVPHRHQPGARPAPPARSRRRRCRWAIATSRRTRPTRPRRSARRPRSRDGPLRPRDRALLWLAYGVGPAAHRNRRAPSASRPAASSCCCSAPAASSPAC